MREVVVFLDQPAEQGIARAAEFLERRGVLLTHRTPYSVSFAVQVSTRPAGPAGLAGHTVAVGGASAGAGTLRPGTGQIASVPVQLRPQWSRQWVTVEGEGPAVEAAAAYVETVRARSREIEAAVRALEANLYSEDSWPEREAMLRASLLKQGTSQEAVEAKIAAFKQRWLALGRKAAKAPPEGHLSA